MFKIKFDFDDHLDLTEPGHTAVLWIDWEDETIDAYLQHETSSTSTPSRAWHGLATYYYLPEGVDAIKLKQFVRDEIVPLATKMLPHFSAEWNGSNWVGKWNYDEDGRSDEFLNLEVELHQLNDDYYRTPGIWDAGDWFLNSLGTDGFIDEYKLRPDMTDREIEDLAEKIDADAQAEHSVVLTKTEELITQIVEEMGAEY